MSTNKVSEKVIAVGVVLADQTRRVAEEHLDELEKLIESAGGDVLARRPRLARTDAIRLLLRSLRVGRSR